jgi:hypothetical protein
VLTCVSACLACGVYWVGRGGTGGDSRLMAGDSRVMTGDSSVMRDDTPVHISASRLRPPSLVSLAAPQAAAHTDVAVGNHLEPSHLEPSHLEPFFGTRSVDFRERGRGAVEDMRGVGGEEEEEEEEEEESIDEEQDDDDPYLEHVSYTPRGSTAGQRRRDASLHLLESTGRLRSQLRRALSLDDSNPGGGGGEASGWETEAEAETDSVAVGARTPAKWQLATRDGQREITSLADAVRKVFFYCICFFFIFFLRVCGMLCGRACCHCLSQRTSSTRRRCGNLGCMMPGRSR